MVKDSKFCFPQFKEITRKIFIKFVEILFLEVLLARTASENYVQVFKNSVFHDTVMSMEHCMYDSVLPE